jgi:hypothetical protein
MSNGDWTPTWLQLGLGAVVAAVSGVAGMVTTALSVSRRLNAIEKGISDGLLNLRLHVDASDSKRFHDMMGVLHQETGKTEAHLFRMDQRLGALEQDQAVFRDFKSRMEGKARGE